MPFCACCLKRTSQRLSILLSCRPLGGCCSESSLIRISSSLLATCHSIQHALRLWVATVSFVVCILHGPSSHPSRTVSCRIAALCFLTLVLGVPRGCALFACRGSWVGTDGSQRAARVSQALSITLYFCAMVAKSANFSMRRRLIALRIPSSTQLLQNADIASSSRQSFTLSLTRRNLAQKWWTVS